MFRVRFTIVFTGLSRENLGKTRRSIMRRIASFAIGLALLAPLLAAAPAHAQATRTWVSGVGDDANPCSRTAPCKTFAGAISKTAASGEINCLDPGGFGAVTITEAKSIVCHHTLGGILSAGLNGVLINAGAADKVHLKGLEINGVNTGTNGIRFIAGSALIVEDIRIDNVSQWGIQFANTATANFEVKNVTVMNAVLGGMQVRPNNAGAVATGIVSNLTAYRGGKGIEIDGNGGSPSNTIIRDSSFSNNSIGVSLTTGATGISAMVTNTAIENNSTAGVSSSANAIARLGANQITGNVVGVSGNVFSFGNNQLRGNSTEGTLTLLAPALQ